MVPTYGAGRVFGLFLLYLKFPPARNASQREAGGKEIPNEQSATLRRESLFGVAWVLWTFGAWRWHFVALFWLLISLIQLRPLSYMT